MEAPPQVVMPEKRVMARTVIVLSVLLCLVQACAILAAVLPVYYEIAEVVPEDYYEFEDKCEKDTTFKDTCKDLREAVRDDCAKQNPPLVLDDCDKFTAQNWHKHHRHYQIMAQWICLIALLFFIPACCMCICGSAGAGLNNRCLVLTYMVFLVMDVMSSIQGALTTGHWAYAISVPLQIGCILTANKLQMAQSQGKLDVSQPMLEPGQQEELRQVQPAAVTEEELHRQQVAHLVNNDAAPGAYGATAST